MKISDGLNKNKSQIILTEKLHPHFKSIETAKINRPINYISLRKKIRENNEPIKVNLLSRYEKLNKQKLKDLTEVKKKNKIIYQFTSNKNKYHKERNNSYFYSNIDKINYISHSSTKENTPKTKEFNNFSFFQSSSYIKQYFIGNSKNAIRKKLFDQNSNNKELNKTFEKYSNRSITSKFIQAKEQWAKNYFATVIQKIFRGYIFRNNFMNKEKSKNRFNIYIKKMPKDKVYLNKFIKIKNADLLAVLKQHNRSVTNMKKSIDEYNKNSDKNEIEVSFNKKTNSKQFNKIKEIVIKKKKNGPIVNLNMNNYFMPNYICQYNNCTYNNNYENKILLNYINNNALQYNNKKSLNSTLK